MPDLSAPPVRAAEPGPRRPRPLSGSLLGPLIGPLIGLLTGRRLGAPGLWVLLVAALVTDVLSSAGALPGAVGVGSGAVALGCIVALITTRVRRRS